MIGFIDAAKMAGGALIGAVVVIAYTHLVSLPAARSEAKQQAKAETLQRAIDLVHERSRTNADVQRLSDSDICDELGGVWRDGICH
jgi:membrane-bound ClpP family serine protease